MPTFEQFKMPDAGEGLTEADIVTWRVAVGDTVEINQPLVEIETAKSLVELPCPFDGVVTKLLAAEGDTVEVGEPIVEIDVDPDGEPSPEPAEPAQDAAASAEQSAPEGANDESSFREGLGDQSEGGSGESSFTTGQADDAAAGSATGDTAGSEAASAQAAAPETQDGESGAVLVGYGVKAGSATRRPRKEGSLDPIGGEGEGDYPVKAKPPVRKLARELGIDITTISPSGPGGIVTRGDVEEQSKARSAKTLATYPGDDQPWLESGKVSPDGRSTRVPVKSVRKRTAEAMVVSAFTAPHVTEFLTVDVTESMNMVAKLKQDRDFADVRVTPLLIVVKALLLAVRRHPEVNASWDDKAQEIVYKHYVNLGIAASTPRGLMVPNIKDAHRLSLHDLAVELQDLTAEARAGRVQPAAMSDGTITITNVGALGIDTGTPILNPGEAAILAFGAVRQQPWVHEGEIQIRWVTQLALSFDHRLVDGELGARLLYDVGRVMNDPSQGLVWG
ncbi:dihydrolipoamide acetyltransferase family protein [Demequina aurantiaca]|uniref:dihydrolipoamide acetyltransferase family protein n=1 Tax=Demequina aurantiaca TaxID=676200 RepID=UPI000781F773|nr:dihydrolipoamide acetyltransferase family protein [Demequina aurantiaca]